MAIQELAAVTVAGISGNVGCCKGNMAPCQHLDNESVSIRGRDFSPVRPLLSLAVQLAPRSIKS